MGKMTDTRRRSFVIFINDYCRFIEIQGRN